MTPWLQELVAVLVESSIRATLIAALVWLGLAALRIRAGSLCHAAWTMVLVAMLLLPVLPKWLPALPMTLPQAPVARTAVERSVTPLGGQWPGNAGATTTGVAAPTLAPAGPAPQRAARPAPPAAPAGGSWLTIAAAIWASGLFAMLFHLAAGWRRAAKLAAASRPAADGVAYESDLVSSPVVVGVFRPRIVVPASWSAWPDEVRRTVLVHERAHIRRHDMVVSLLARLARAIYWFHPLAWWLERRLTSAAEQACDDEAVRDSVGAARYAELLVLLAGAVRARGGRVAWHGLGMAGGRSLGARIDRVLGGAADAIVTPARKLVVLAFCTAVVVPGVACRQRVPQLREDPELARNLQQQKEHNERIQAASSLTLEQVGALEAAVAKNPDDLDATRQLLAFYNQSGQKLMGWNDMVAARRALLLRAIERHPEWDLVWWPLPQRLDPEGWAKARELWLKHLERPDVTPKILAAAASFFGISEKPVAEQILLRAQGMDPKGPQPRVEGNVYHSPWSARLGELYARAIVGSDDNTLFNVVRSVSLDEARGPFAAKARKILETTTDPVLLRAAGSYLTQNAGGRDGKVGDQKITLGLDHRALGESYLDRSIALDPDSETTRRFVAYRERARVQEAHYNWLRATLGQSWSEAPTERIAALAESDRLDALPTLASHAYMWAESVENTTKDAAKFRELIERAKAFSEQALTLAEKFRDDPRYRKTVFEAHMIRGVVALREGDRRLAVTHLRAGANVVSGGDMPGNSGLSLQSRLTNYLLKDGERESVAEFFEKVSKVAGPNQQEFADAAKAIREGRMPRGYQYAMTPH